MADDDRPPPPRKRYKEYADPDKAYCQVPRTSSWRASNPTNPTQEVHRNVHHQVDQIIQDIAGPEDNVRRDENEQQQYADCDEMDEQTTSCSNTSCTQTPASPSCSRYNRSLCSAASPPSCGAASSSSHKELNDDSLQASVGLASRHDKEFVAEEDEKWTSDSEGSDCGFQVQACRMNPEAQRGEEGQIEPQVNDNDGNWERPFDDNEDIDLDSLDDEVPGVEEVVDADAHQAVEVHPRRILFEKLEADYGNRIEKQPAATRGETLLNILEFSKHYSLPVAAQEDLHRLVNSIFHQEVLPESRYKIDKLYSCGKGVQFIFYCSKCSFSFGHINRDQVKSKVCDICSLENFFSDLTKSTYYVIFDIVDQLQLLLNQPDVAINLKNPKDFLVEDDSDVMSDMHSGSMYKTFASSLDYSEDFTYLSFTACTDGTPIFKSSNSSIWPLFVIVNELPPHMRMSNILLCGLWFQKHPKMDLFLDGFTDYITKLSNQGFSLNIGGTQKNCKAFLIACCVDSGARGSVQGIHSHSGQYSCNWCLHPGESEGEGSSARKFRILDEQPEKRTMDEIKRDGSAVLQLTTRDAHVNGVLSLSPLLRAPKFDIVNGMVVNVLHWANFGIGRQFLKIWLGERNTLPTFLPDGRRAPKPPYYVGTPETQEVISKRILKIHPPKEVRRLPRDISVFLHWKAREWENFILYYSVPVLKNILPEQYLKHWTLFVQALYVLMMSDVKRTQVVAAEQLLKKFVEDIGHLYNWKEMTFNVHITDHVAENVMRWGPLWSVSTFAFENGNGLLKKKIHAERGIAHQIIRSLATDSSLQVLQQQAQTAQTTRFKAKMKRKEIVKCFYINNIMCISPSPFQGNREELWHCREKRINFNDYKQCKKIIVNHICYSPISSAKTNNSFSLLKDGSIVKIRKIIASELHGQVLLFVSKVRTSPYALPNNEHRLMLTPFLHHVHLIEEGSSIIDWRELDKICVFVDVSCTFFSGQFVSVMANTVNTF